MVPLTSFFFVFFFFLTQTLTSVNSQQNSSIYEALKAYGLPMGLLPKGIINFNLDETGRFEVHLDQACNAKFESEIHYERNVSGTLSYGKIESLTGISAQELFLWFPVKGIRVDVPSSGLIYFDVGVVFKQFSLSLFERPRKCMVVRDGVPEEVENGKVIAEAVLKVRKIVRIKPRNDTGKKYVLLRSPVQKPQPSDPRLSKP